MFLENYVQNARLQYRARTGAQRSLAATEDTTAPKSSLLSHAVGCASGICWPRIAVVRREQCQNTADNLSLQVPSNFRRTTNRIAPWFKRRICARSSCWNLFHRPAICSDKRPRVYRKHLNFENMAKMNWSRRYPRPISISPKQLGISRQSRRLRAGRVARLVALVKLTMVAQGTLRKVRAGDRNRPANSFAANPIFLELFPCGITSLASHVRKQATASACNVRRRSAKMQKRRQAGHGRKKTNQQWQICEAPIVENICKHMLKKMIDREPYAKIVTSRRASFG